MLQALIRNNENQLLDIQDQISIPILANTPQELINSFQNINIDFIHENNLNRLEELPYSTEKFLFKNLEDGCWIINSKIHFQKTVVFELLKKNNQREDYHLISLNYIIKKNEDGVKKNISWTFFKPLETKMEITYKGYTSQNIAIYINQKWILNNLQNNPYFIESRMIDFLNSNKKHLFIPIDEKEKTVKYFNDFDKILGSKDQINKTDLLGLKYKVISLLLDFFKQCKDRRFIDKELGFISKKNVFNIENVEVYLNQNLDQKFLGLSTIAQHFNISESKLKKDFKLKYGVSVYQYFQNKQMMLAKKILTETNISIKELSNNLGYESQSKFSLAFKKANNLVPKSIKKTD